MSCLVELVESQVLCSRTCWVAAQVANLLTEPDTMVAVSTGMHKLKGVTGEVSG